MRSDRSLAIATAVVFAISTAFPIAAALSKNASALPRMIGITDGILAFILVTMTMVLHARTRGKVTREAEDAAYRAYRVLAHVTIVLLVVFFLFGDGIEWTILLVGLAWRTWLLLYTLPVWYTALRTSA